MIEHDTRIGPRSNRLKRLRRLVTRRRARSTERAFVVEGPVLIAEALDAAESDGLELVALYAEPDAPGDLLERAAASGVEIVDVAEGALSSVLDTVSPRPVAAEVRWSDATVGAVVAAVAPDRPILVLAELAEPGNVGTLIRTAEAAGFGAVVITGEIEPGTDAVTDAGRGALDPTSPKVVRAAAGALFRLPVVTAGWDEAVDAVVGSGRHLVATVVDADATPYDETDLAGVAVVLGSEAHGLRSAQIARCHRAITIPLDGPTESLNVAAAGAIVCFASAQQRRRAAGGRNSLANPPSPTAG